MYWLSKRKLMKRKTGYRCGVDDIEEEGPRLGTILRAPLKGIGGGTGT
jgi:hypothetical protein